MIYNYPFFSFPRPKKYSSFNYNTFPVSNSYNYYKKTAKPEVPYVLANKEKRKDSFESKESLDEPFFEILGLKLYFDDILIICLIFFLYQEGVKDEYLFISLILLLLS